MRVRAYLIHLLLSFVATAACDATPISTCNAPPGVLAIANRGPGVWEQQGVRPHLTELWRAAGQRGDQILGETVLAAASRDQHLALADFQLGVTAVVLSNGSWQDGWTRTGAGPGEIQNPIAVNWTDSGNLVVFDIVAPKVAFLDAPGHAVGELAVPPSLTSPILASGEVRGAAVLGDGGVLLIPPVRPVADDPTAADYLIVHWRPAAASVDTVAAARVALSTDRGWRTTVPGRPHPVFAAGGGGFAVGAGTAYRIVIYSQDGAPVRVICRDAPPLPIRDAELDLPADAATPPTRFPPPPADSTMAFGRLLLGARGWLWVQRDRPVVGDRFYGPPGATWDVFDETGRYLGEVQAPPRARLQASSGPEVFAFEIGDLDEIEVVAYALTIEPGDT